MGRERERDPGEGRKEDPERDRRAGESPPKSEPEHEPAEERSDRSSEAPGPYGNPGVDEEALRHRQQERP